MTANVIPFTPRSDYVQPVVDNLSSAEVYKKLEEETLARLKSMIQYYESTGRWNTACDQPIVDIVRLLKQVCHLLSENGTANHEDKAFTAPSESRGSVRTATETHQDSGQGQEPPRE
jgi:hypothetical protein